MRVAAYQMPVTACYDGGALDLIRDRVRQGEREDVQLLCCPEAALGGLADYVESLARIDIPADRRALAAMLRPLASPTVTVVVGFTERDEQDRYYNAAAVYAQGTVVGVYRKRHPAIRRSRYTAGTETPVFDTPMGTIGILICRDSIDMNLAATLVRRGAQILCIPTNNAMPPDRGGPRLADDVRAIDTEHARTLDLPVIRADVIGASRGVRSPGTSAITRPRDTQVCAGGCVDGELIVAELR